MGLGLGISSAACCCCCSSYCRPVLASVRSAAHLIRVRFRMGIRVRVRVRVKPCIGAGDTAHDMSAPR